jgi:[ribosomal protein S5]-alanine N-acetyltransferase
MGFKEAFAEFPVLETNNLLLRQLTEEDAEDFYAVWADPGMQKGFDARGFRDISGAQKHLRVKRNAFKRKQVLTWGISIKGRFGIVGACLYGAFEQQSIADLSYYLASSHWGKGIMSEALGAVVPFGQQVMELHRIQAFIRPDNIGSIRVAEKSGLVREGVLRRYHHSPHTGWVDKAVYAQVVQDPTTD